MIGTNYKDLKIKNKINKYYKCIYINYKIAVYTYKSVCGYFFAYAYNL